eukprot:s381_g33.t1
MANSSEKTEVPKVGAASGWPFLLISAALLPVSMWYQHSMMSGHPQTQVERADALFVASARPGARSRSRGLQGRGICTGGKAYDRGGTGREAEGVGA